MRVLLDASVDAITLGKIRALIMDAAEVVDIEELVARNSGRYLFVQANVIFRIADLKRAHLASQRIEAEIRKEFPHVDRVLIHYEPRKQRSLRYAAALQDAQGTLGEHFGESPYFAIVEIDLQEMKLAKQEIIANPHKDLAKGKGLKIARFLLTYKPDVIFCRENLSGKGPGYAFAEAGVETFQTQARTLEELVNDQMEEKNGNIKDKH